MVSVVEDSRLVLCDVVTQAKMDESFKPQSSWKFSFSSAYFAVSCGMAVDGNFTSVAMDSKVLVVNTSLKRVVSLSILVLTGITELQHGTTCAASPFLGCHACRRRHKTRGHEMKVVISRI